MADRNLFYEQLEMQNVQRPERVDDLFDNRSARPTPTNDSSVEYDVIINWNASGPGGNPVIRFGFCNRGAEAFEGVRYIQVSDVSQSNDGRLWFRPVDRKDRYMHTYTMQVQGEGKKSYSFSMTPKGGQASIYEMHWVKKVYSICYSLKEGKYYISYSDGVAYEPRQN